MKSSFTRSHLRRFLAYYKPYRRLFAVDLLLIVISSAAFLLFPLVSGYLTGEVLSSFDEGTQRRLLLCGAVLLALILMLCLQRLLRLSRPLHGRENGARYAPRVVRPLRASVVCL